VSGYSFLFQAHDALRNQLSAGLAQAKAGDLAEGSGKDAIRRVFATARGTP
jgi:antitoxin ParD1/3/4